MPSDDAAYNVNPSQDLNIRSITAGGKAKMTATHQLRSMICLSKTSLATMSGRADFVCQTDTDLSSAPNATTEQMFEVEMGDEGIRRKIWGL